MLFIILAILLIIMTIKRPPILGSASNTWNSARVDDFGDFLSMGTDWQVCNIVMRVINNLSYPVIAKSSRYWRDSNTFIENLKQITIMPGESTHQNVGWAGLGAKEYRVSFYKEDGSPLKTSSLQIDSWRPLACNEFWSDTLGLID